MVAGSSSAAPSPAHEHSPLTRQVAASNGFSLVALSFAVLASVVGAVLTSALGTDQLGRLGGAAIGPVVTATFTTWWAGGRGRVQLLVIGVLSALAVVITVSGFLVADTVAEEPVLGDGGSIVPADVIGADSTDSPPDTGDPAPADLAVGAVSAEGGVTITVSNVGAADAAGFVVALDGDPADSFDGLAAWASTEAFFVPCAEPPLEEPTASVAFTDSAVVDPDETNNAVPVPGACLG